MYDVWHGKDATQLDHIKRNRGPTIKYMVLFVYLPRKLNVELTGRDKLPVRYTNLNGANIRLDLSVYGPHI